MNEEEINIRAWQQMEVLTDQEVLTHSLLTENDLQEVGNEIWYARIKLRDKFFNEILRDFENHD